MSAAPHENLAEHNAQQRKSTADLVVKGVVTSVRLPEDGTGQPPAGPHALGMAAGVGGAGGDAPANGGDAQARPISEHDPLWREAVVNVSQVEKGQHDQKSVVVRFPSSTDVRWYRAPKFQAGQEGTFILHRHTLHRPTQRLLAQGVGDHAEAADSTEVYTALDPADFQPG